MLLMFIVKDLVLTPDIVVVEREGMLSTPFAYVACCVEVAGLRTTSTSFRL
jgi:hypothetical protein